MKTNLALHQGHPRRPGGQQHPARLRALRLLHRDLSDLSAARRRAGRAARAHLPDEGGAGGPRGHREDPAAPGPLPHLPLLRDHLPFGRASTGGWSTSAAISSSSTSGARRSKRSSARPCARSSPTRRCSTRCSGSASSPARCCRRRSAARCLPARTPALGRRPGMPAACWCCKAACSRASPPTSTRRVARVLDRIGISLHRRAASRLLRRRVLSPQRPGGRARLHAPEHRCLVAVRGARRRSDRDDRERLRGHGEGVRPPARRAIRATPRRRSGSRH